MGPLVYLTLCSLRNRVRVRLRRLKQPRYLVGLFVGLAYFGFAFVLPRMRISQMDSPRFTAEMSAMHLALELAGAAFLFLLFASAWIPIGNRGPALYFTQADVHFLFPAPLSRKELIRYKLIRPQAGMLISSMFMTLVFHPFSFANSWMFFVGIALTMNVLNIYMTGVSLRRESLGSHGIAGLARQWLPLAVVSVAVAILVGTLVSDWPTLSSQSGSERVQELYRLASTGASGVVMWPFRTLMRLPGAENPLEFFLALPWVVLMLILGYFWVIRSDAKFEEASAAISAEVAEKVARFNKGQRMSAPKLRAGTRIPFTLALEGRAETAIFWKNLILVGRYVSLRTLVRLLPILILLATLSRMNGTGSVGSFVSSLCAMAFVFTLLMGPLLSRSDLRRDLIHLGLLKTWPVDGATIVRGEVMAPAALLTTIAWLSASGMLAFGQRFVPPSWIVAAILLAPGLIVLRLLGQNAMAVMWPSWFLTGPSRAFGIDVMGQRIIVMLGFLIVLVVAAVPAAIIAGIVAAGTYWVTGAFAVIIPAAVAGIALLVEAYLASHAIGKLLDRTDVSAVDALDN